MGYDKSKNLEPITFEGKHLIYRNFAGRFEENNENGQHNFAIKISMEEAAELEKMGIVGIKYPKPEVMQDPEEPDYRKMPWVKVIISYNHGIPEWLPINIASDIGEFPPYRVDNTDENQLAGMCDDSVLKFADIEVVPNYWTHGSKQGYTLYLKSIYLIPDTQATLEREKRREEYARNASPFAKKYQ